MKKFLLIIPPVWNNKIPQMAAPVLSAQLKRYGFHCNIYDLNIEFYNDILTPEFIDASVEKIKKKYENVSVYDNQYTEYFYNKVLKNIDAIKKNILPALNIIRDTNKFYDIHKLRKAEIVLNSALFVINLPYQPIKITLRGFWSNSFFRYNYNDIKQLSCDESKNIFLSYYKNKIQHIKSYNADFIGISITDSNNLIGGLTLSHMLKNNTDAYISIGGDHFTRMQDNLIKFPDFFDMFADSVMYGEGEVSVIDMARYINNEISIDEVHNIIYKKDDKIIINPKAESVNINDLPIPDYSEIDFKKYFVPFPIIPISVSKGCCYWNNCAFCDMSFPKKYSLKKLDKLVEELKEYKTKYNNKEIIFIDDSIPPKYLDNLFDAMIENNFDFIFELMFRFEKYYNSEFFKKAYKAGLRLAYWGYEYTNKRLMNLINKGIDTSIREKLLKYANKAGIHNIVYVIKNFPTSTYKETKETINIWSKNKIIMSGITASDFTLTNHSDIYKNPDKYGVEISPVQDDFSPVIRYRNIDHPNTEEISKINNLFNDLYLKYYGKTIMSQLDRDYVLAYVDKYGEKYILKKL